MRTDISTEVYDDGNTGFSECPRSSFPGIYSDSVLVSKYTKLTASTFTEDNIRKSTKDQAVGTEPKSEPVTVPTSVAVVEKSDKGDKNEDDSAFVKTGKWYIALLILAVLIVCSTVLFVMRKRDIYDN